MRRKNTPNRRHSLIPILAVVVLGLAIGLARGGSFATLGRARLRLVPLVFVGLLLQVLGLFGSRAVAVALTVVASAAVLAFAAANMRVPGMLLIALGAMMNLTVVLANGGMPLDRDALGRAGLDHLLASGRPPAAYRVAGPDTRLRFLGDVLAMPPPVGRVYSPGDVVLWTGLLVVVQGLMLSRGRRRAGLRRPEEPPAAARSVDQ